MSQRKLLRSKISEKLLTHCLSWTLRSEHILLIPVLRAHAGGGILFPFGNLVLVHTAPSYYLFQGLEHQAEGCGLDLEAPGDPGGF